MVDQDSPPQNQFLMTIQSTGKDVNQLFIEKHYKAKYSEHPSVLVTVHIEVRKTLLNIT